jgi:hypothetical protein
MQNQSNFKKEETHKRIEDNFNHLIKYLGNIFEKIKFNQEKEDTNSFEILTSSEAITIRLEELTKIVSELKIDFLKKNSFDVEQIKGNKKKLDSYMSEMGQKMIDLQNIHDNASNLLKEWKQNKNYKFTINQN